MTIAVAALAPTVVVAEQEKDDSSLSYYSYGGSVIAQLPEGIPSHPTTLLIASFHCTRQGDYPVRGPHDVFVVYLWVPVLNDFLPVTAISDHPNPAHHELIKEVYNGTPLWIPGLFENCIVVDDEVIVTSKRGNVFFANLTEGVHISLPFNMLVGSPLEPLGDLSFDLPPIALEVRGIDGVYREEGSSNLPSGYSAASNYLRKPAWVRVWIQEWSGGINSFQFAGVMGVYSKTTFTPPPA
jgi:hypothetical protein